MSLFKNFWRNDRGKKLAIGCAIFGILWSTAWTFQDGALNLVPACVGVGLFLMVFGFYWLFRNNP
jgi:hypothetical protein